MFLKYGAIAQLGERFAGSEEVGGSSPPGSTKCLTFRTHLNSTKAKAEKGFTTFYILIKKDSNIIKNL